MTDINYSVIIPHYNIPDLLMRALKSIPVREDIQVIVVDDNSVGADTYLERYSELSRPYLEFVRTTKGRGAGYARNVGLEHAKGKWILFADADDFYVEDMYDIICSYVDSEADVIYFRKRSVLSENISIEKQRSSYIDIIIDRYLTDGDEWPVRFNLPTAWGKMVKRDLLVKHSIRFDEIVYSADVFFSLRVGYYAETINVVNRVLYVVTCRPDSLSADFCSKPRELKQRTEVTFRCDKFMLQNRVCRGRMSNRYLLKMYKHDRRLYKFYFFKLDEIYPSKLSALRDISKGKSLRFKIKFYLYSFMVWARVL